MTAMLLQAQRWLSFPISPEEIRIPGASCPADPFSNAPQIASAALQSEAWQGLFAYVLVLSAAIGFIAVLATYPTRKVGHVFFRRWLRGLGVSAFLAGLVSLGMLLFVEVPTSGCPGGVVINARIPGLWVFLRTVLAAFHGALFFVVLSALLGLLLGRVLGWKGWYDNYRIPFPYLFSRMRS